MADKSKILWRHLYSDGSYTKSYPEFIKQFSTPEKINSLHALMQSDGDYTKTADEFASQFFSNIPVPQTPPVDRKLTIKDLRTVDSITGQPMNDRSRLGGVVDESHVRQVAEKARQHGVDPYTALAMNIQETGFNPEYADNPFMITLPNPTDLMKFQEDPIDYSIQKIAEKQKQAVKWGKSGDAELIQAWNGYGKIASDMGGKKLYGIDISKEPLDMSKNPVYGKRIVDIRDNILKQDPEIVRIVDEVAKK